MALPYRPLRQLTLAPGLHPRGLAFLSAASGLVRVGARLYVVADDELHLGVFPVDGDEPGHLVRLLEGTLPASAKKRKAAKPDFESLLALPASDASPGGSLLALGSGSRANRFDAALLGLDAAGESQGNGRAISLAPLYAALADRFDEINIEGAFVTGDALLLLQRGVGIGASAAIRYDLADVMGWLDGGAERPLRPRSVRAIDLGAVRGVALGFTDGAALDDGAWAFSAVAEDRDDSVADGPCLAGAVGICDGDDTLQCLELIEPTRKIEGIAVAVSGATAVFTLVTDADDPDRPAELGTVRLALRAPAARSARSAAAPP